MQNEGLPISLPLLAVLETTDLMKPFNSAVIRVCDDVYITIPQIPQVQLIRKKEDMNRLIEIATKVLPLDNLSSKYLNSREFAILSEYGNMN